MVIPVCYRCYTPVKIVSEPADGLEVIRYHCAECDHSAASFLLGYVEGSEAELEAALETGDVFTHRAEVFKDTNKHYKLRAKMQGLLDLRASTDGRRPEKPIADSSEEKE